MRVVHRHQDLIHPNVLILLKSSHPPADATTLIVSVGFLQTPSEMAALMVGVAILTIVGWIVNRGAGERV